MMRRTNTRLLQPLPLTSSSSSNYKIIQWNVRNIRFRSLDLGSLLLSEECSFALMSETWLRLGEQFALPSFHLIRSDRPDGYGGVAIASHLSIQLKEIPIDPSLKNNLIHHSIDLVGIEAFINSYNPVRLWSWYISLSANPPSFLIDNNF